MSQPRCSRKSPPNIRRAALRVMQEPGASIDRIHEILADLSVSDLHLVAAQCSGMGRTRVQSEIIWRCWLHG